MKARNREINIFNMSLLDILCGALGAFCFMMLSLLPYYRPNNDGIQINQDQKKLLDSVQHIKDLAERLKSASNVEDLSELVKQLQVKILEMENDIRRLQGTVNSLLAENEDLKKKLLLLEQEKQQLLAAVQKLEQEKQQLVAVNQQLEQEKQKLAAENQRLGAENQRLKFDNEQLQRALNQKVPWIVTMAPAKTSQRLDLSLHETKLKYRDGTLQPDFDPKKQFQPTFVRGDKGFAVGSSSVLLSAERAVGSARKLYVSLTGQSSTREETEVSGFATGSLMRVIDLPRVFLTPERLWALMGTFEVTPEGELKFIAATDEERDAEWKRLMSTEAPVVQESKSPTRLSREEMLERLRRDEAIRTGRSDAPDPAMETRLRAFSQAFIAAKTDEEKRQIYDKAVQDATGDRERALIRAMMMNLTRGPAPPPAKDGQK